jgi:cell envelope opacity-associated protein A
LEKFETAAEASFQHHWNNHQFCSSWCQAKDWNAEEKEELKNKFRDKEKNPKEYKQQFLVQMKFTAKPPMRRVLRKFCTIKTEQIHFLVTMLHFLRPRVTKEGWLSMTKRKIFLNIGTGGK